MKIVISGCGKIGTKIAASLVWEGHNVTVVDADYKVVDEVTNIHDAIGVVGNCADYEVLKEAEVDKAELYVAMTGSDELNMLSCFIAKKMGAKHTIARVRNPEYNDSGFVFMKEQLDISMSINPELLAAKEIFNILQIPSAIKVETFSRRNFEIVEFILKDSSPIVGKKLVELREKHKEKFLICSVLRGDKVFIPDGNFVLKEGDRIGITAELPEISKFFKDIGMEQKQAKNVMITGGSRISYYLAEMLTKNGTSVKIIEKDKEICNSICEGVPKASVINMNGSAQEVLMEEGIQRVDAFASLSPNDEENILVSIFASSQNVKKVITRVTRDELGTLAERLGLETVISPMRIVEEILVRYARALKNSLGSNIETLYTFMEGKAEAVEFNVKNDFKGINVPIKDLKMKENILIAGILRDNNSIIPIGGDVIMEGDKVVVVSSDLRLNDLSDILK